MAIQKSFNYLNKSSKVIIIAAAVSLLASFPLYSASIEEFQTEEYYGSGGLDLINAAEAYAKDYTGKGITIGINDDPVNFEHESFADKTGSKYVGSLSLAGIDWNEYYHGTAMGSISAGSKNNKGMHGVAFDADIISSCFLGENSDFPKYDSYPEIKIINNSWASFESADIFYSSEEVGNLCSKEVLDYLNTKVDFYEKDNDIKDAASKDRLLIFGNNNDGAADVQAYMFIHWFNNVAVNNIITVTGALNSYNQSEHLKRNEDGNIYSDFINAPFSNFAKYSEDFTLVAPGWNINLSSAIDKNGYLMGYGVSASAAFVSGGAVLVQQAFPYMNSKQIGDVLLSTANSNIKIQHPFSVNNYFTWSIDKEGNPLYDDNGYLICKSKASIYYHDERTQSSDDQIKKNLLKYADSIKNDNYTGQDYAYDIKIAIEQGNISVYYQTPIQEIVGQGVLDVGKAVSGPGALNARRLEKENISDKYLTDGQNTVMYDIDTKGYDSGWDNDIKEIRAGKIAGSNTEKDLIERYNYYNINWISNDKADNWQKALTKYYVEEFNRRVDESGLEGLHVGLLKSGKGVLKLNGNNTYQGPTVVTDGAIAINGSVAGDAYSEDNGIIMGKGKINGTLYNNNVAIAGDGGEGNLSMNALESKGTLTAVVNDKANTKFIVNGEANVDGSTIKVQGLVPGESYTVLTANSINGELANGKDNSSPVNVFMSEYAKVEDNTIKVVSEFSNELNAINNSGEAAQDITFTKKQQQAFGMIKNLYFNLMADLPEGAASYRTSLRASTTPQQINQIMTMINLPAAQAGPALNAVINNAAAQSMTLVQRNSFVGDILSSHFAQKLPLEGKWLRSNRKGDLTRENHDSMEQTSSQANAKNTPFSKGGCPQSGQGDFKENLRISKEVALPLVKSPLRLAAQATSPQGEALEPQAHNPSVTSSSVTLQSAKADSSPQVEPLDNAAWFKFTYNKGEMRDGARYRGRSGIIGYDLKLTDTKSFGLFFGQANNTLDGFEDAWAKNKIEENRFGLYSSKKNDKFSGYLFLDYGKVDNELNRNLTNLGFSTNVKYKGDLYEIGGEYKLTPNNQKNKSWKVYPYINLQFSKYKQDGYTEKDGGIYNHVVEGKSNNYAAGQLGLEFNFSNEKENYVLRLAGKRAFSGADPKLTFSFAGDMANKYELDNDQDKNHLLVSFKGERKISNNTLLSADFAMKRGSHDRDMKASLSFWRRF